MLSVVPAFMASAADVHDLQMHVHSLEHPSCQVVSHITQRLVDIWKQFEAPTRFVMSTPGF